MSLIVLTATEKNKKYGHGTILIKQDYPECQLFFKYEHYPDGPVELGSIRVFNEYFNKWYNKIEFFFSGSSSDPYVTLTHVQKPKKDRLLSSHVYFCTYNEDYPLLLRLNLEGDQSRYYTRSQFDYDFKTSRTRKIFTLPYYADEKGILNVLLDQNEAAKGGVTYEIESTGIYRRIDVQQRSNYPNPLYTKYEHRSYLVPSNKISYVLYNKQPLIGKKGVDGKYRQLREVQDKRYTGLNVYYGANLSFPLLLEFEKQGETRDYYFHARDNDEKLYWEPLKEDLRNINQLAKKLDEIRLSYLYSLYVLAAKFQKYAYNDVPESIRTKIQTRVTSNDIIVINKTEDYTRCLRLNDFNVYEHDFSGSISYVRQDPVRIKLVGSKDETIPTHIIVIDLNQRNIVNPYKTGSYSMSLGKNTFNDKSDYIYYDHTNYYSYKITKGHFAIKYNEILLNIHGDLEDNVSHNQRVNVYYRQNYLDKFILILFPLADVKKVKYLVYSEFIRFYNIGKEINLSSLPVLEEPQGFQLSLNIGTKLRDLLDKEYSVVMTTITNEIDTLYFSMGEITKLYLFYHQKNPDPLLICYKDRAYTRHYMTISNSKWVRETSINSCLCKNDFLSEGSDKKLYDTLNNIAIRYGLIEVIKTSKIHDVSIKFDISKTGTINYDSGKITVSGTKIFEDCDLFNYCIHTPVLPVFNSISFECSAHNKIISFRGIETSYFQSLTVYFNKYIPDRPVLAKIKTNNVDKYYRNLIQENQTYTIYQDSIITSSDFLLRLIEDSDKYNKTVTYQIDKTNGPYFNINIFSQTSKQGYTTYTHSPTTSTSNKGFFLYKNMLLRGRSSGRTETIDAIQNQDYDTVTVYCFDNDKNLPLLISLKKSRSNFVYSNKKDKSGDYWNMEYFDDFNEEAIKHKLDFLYYMLKKSVVIELDYKFDSSYPIKLVENIQTDDMPSKIQYSKSKTLKSPSKISVSPRKRINEGWKDSGFNYVTHVIELSSISEMDKKDIGGIRFFMTKLGVGNVNEIMFYNKLTDNLPRDLDRRLFYYKPDSVQTSSIYIYFYGEDTRILLFCYMYKSYNRVSGQNAVQWVYNRQVKCFESSNTLGLLKHIYSSMKKKFTFIKNGQNQDNIIVRSIQNFYNFKKESYTPAFAYNPSGPFVLSKSILTKGIGNHTFIDKLLDDLQDKTFDEVNIYYNSSRNSPLMIEFINDSTKTFFVSKDPDSKYWVIKNFEHQSLENVLPKIESTIKSTVVYEIDKKITNYSSTTSVQIEDVMENEFTKHIHKAAGEPRNKASLVLFNGIPLKCKKLGELETVEDLQDQNYLNVNVYFGKRTEYPLITQFTRNQKVTTFYLLKREDNELFWEKMNIGNIDFQSTELISRLREVEFDLINSLIILIGCKENSYGQAQISEAINSLATKRHINTYKIQDNIVVNNTNSDENCLKHYGFVLCEHYLTKVKIGSNKKCGLRFFTYSTMSGIKYSVIELKDFNGKQTEYLYCNTLNDPVYVYFYYKDPRPLLMCYDGKLYVPMNKSTYDTTWTRVNNLNECVCSFMDADPLLRELIKVIGFLNEVKLDQHPEITFRHKEEANTPGRITKSYSVQQYNENQIQIQVSYENKSCYRKYKHVPKGVSNGTGFRLGNVIYNSFRSDTQIPTTNYPLESVSVYYNTYDSSHLYPLLVILNSRNNESVSNSTEYYKLSHRNTYEWVNMNNNGNDNNFISEVKKFENNLETDLSTEKKKELDNIIEEKIHEIKENLGITFTEEQKNSYLFKPLFCNDDQNKTPLIAGATGGSVGVVALGTGTGVLLAKYPQIIIPSIKPLL